MPELPEVETIVRGLSNSLKGLEIAEARLLCPYIYKDRDPSDFAKIRGKRISDIKRRGKMILLDFENSLTFCVHLGMTGQLFYSYPGEPVDRHTHFILSFEDYPQELRFRDVRKFGFVSCLSGAQSFGRKRLGRLGPEPLEIRYSDFFSLFKGRRAKLKTLLLDQSFIAGIGNIYGDEILFRAKLHPLRQAHLVHEDEKRRLWRAIKEVLSQAIEHRGSSVRDYRDSESRRGRFQQYHRVYGKESCSCSICGQKIVRIRINGRSSFFCPGCQPFGTKPKK
jgi:formamidopyrimidine-DNA glycosylase